MPDKIYLIDGSGYIFRAYYAVQRLSTKAGFPTNALFGFVKMLIKLLSDPELKHVAMIFDAGRDTFRKEIYPEYKANREECPEDLKQQMPYFRDFSKAMGLPIFEQKGFEADDIIGTLARRLREQSDSEVVIVSGDKDLMQLVGENVTVWDTMKDRRYDADGVKEKLGVLPDKVVELLGLMGDSSDNIPGVNGVGPKTAQQLLEHYGDIEQVIESTDKIKENKSIRGREKIAESIELNKELLRLSRKLVEIKQDVPVTFNNRETATGEASNGEARSGEATVQVESLSAEEIKNYLKRNEPLPADLDALSKRFEFSNLFKDFTLNAKPQASQPVVSYHLITQEKFDNWLKTFHQQLEVSFDLETTSLDTENAKLVGASFCWGTEAYYIPVGHVGIYNTKHNQVSVENFIEHAKSFFENSKIKKIGQNLKYDCKVLAHHGVNVAGLYFDTMLASYVLDPDSSSHGLTALAEKFLNKKVIEFTDLVGKDSDFSETDIQEATKYACQDAHFAWDLKQILYKKLEQNSLLEVFQNIEMSLLPVLIRMELQGVKLDTAMLAEFSKELSAKLAVLEERIYELALGRFNINSPKQLAEVLFNRLGISTTGVKKTKTGFSTDSSVLEKLADQHLLPAQILEYRGLHKLKSTYVDALPMSVSPKTKRLHTKFNQTGTATGRLSSSDPNLQNIPIQSSEGKRVRAAFIAEPGKTLISADYSQIELRLLAHLSGDTNMCQAFKDSADIHSNTARDLLGLPAGSEITPEQRRIGKTINFGVVYGMGGFRLARELGISASEGTRYIDQYFKHFFGVRSYFNKLEDQAETEGYVSTMFGRRRYLTSVNINERDPGFLKRVAINAPIQGSAADLIKLAMIKIDRVINQQKLPLKLLLQIHDELVLECEQSFVEQAKDLVRTEMEGVCKLQVPLKVDIGVGENWLSAK